MAFSRVSLIAVLFFVLITKTLAVTAFYPVVSFSAGKAYFNLEETQNFIQGDSFYNYEGQNASANSGVGGVFLGAEFPFTSHVLYATELGLSYYQESSFEQNGLLTQGVDPRSYDQYSYQYSILTRQLFAEGKLLLTGFRGFHPYFIAGIGESFNKLRQYTVDYNPFLTFTPLWNDHANQQFAYHFGVGVDKEIFSWLRFGLGYRYFNLGRANFNNGYIDTVAVNSQLKQCLATQTFMGQVTFIL